MVTVKESPVHGKGVFASSNILKGEVIVKSHMVLIHVNENLPWKISRFHNLFCHFYHFRYILKNSFLKIYSPFSQANGIDIKRLNMLLALVDKVSI